MGNPALAASAYLEGATADSLREPRWQCVSGNAVDKEVNTPAEVREKGRQLTSNVGPRGLDERRLSNRPDGPTLIHPGAAYARSFVERFAMPLQNMGSASMKRGCSKSACARCCRGTTGRTRSSASVRDRDGERIAACPALQSTNPKEWHRPAGYSSGPNSGNRSPTRSNRRASFLCDDIPSDPAAGRKPPSVACAMIASAMSRSSSKLPGQS